MLHILFVLAQATSEVQTTTLSLAKDISQLGVSGLAIFCLVAVWRTNTRLAKQNTALHDRIATMAENRVKEERENTRAMTEALILSTHAGKEMSAALENNNRLIERWLRTNGHAERKTA